jgi:hypothetical protein
MALAAVAGAAGCSLTGAGHATTPGDAHVAGQKGSPVAMVVATSPRFHTASGARLGASSGAVRALGHMDCGPTTGTTPIGSRSGG